MSNRELAGDGDQAQERIRVAIAGDGETSDLEQEDPARMQQAWWRWFAVASPRPRQADLCRKLAWERDDKYRTQLASIAGSQARKADTPLTRRGTADAILRPWQEGTFGSGNDAVLARNNKARPRLKVSFSDTLLHDIPASTSQTTGPRRKFPRQKTNQGRYNA